MKYRVKVTKEVKCFHREKEGTSIIDHEEVPSRLLLTETKQFQLVVEVEQPRDFDPEVVTEVFDDLDELILRHSKKAVDKESLFQENTMKSYCVVVPID